MVKTKVQFQIADEAVMNKIYVVRKQKVMMDRDLAELYGVETKQLKQAVRRNRKRFPKDFMFEMSPAEFKNWRSHFVTSNSDKRGLRYKPYCFSEQGVTMIACILNSDRAIAVNIQLIRIFTRMREMLLTHKDILLQLEKIEQKISGHDAEITAIFNCLKQLINPPPVPRPRIGFRKKNEAE